MVLATRAYAPEGGWSYFQPYRHCDAGVIQPQLAAMLRHST